MKGVCLLIICLSHAFTVLGQDCRFTLSASFSTQVFTSPNYPSNYGNNLDCVWVIASKSESEVEIFFNDFATEIDYDEIEIRDGNASGSPLLETFSGTSQNINRPYFSSGGFLRLSFTSDRSLADRGFRVSYRLALPTKYNITVVIQSELTETTVTSRVTNRYNVVRKVTFFHLMMKEAVITSFEMLVDGELFQGRVESKEENAERNDSRVRGITGETTTAARKRVKRFTFSTDVARDQVVTFRLKYFHVITRHQSRYIYRSFIARSQFINDVCVDIYLCTGSEINLVRIPNISRANMFVILDKESRIPPGFTVIRNRNFAHISYRHPQTPESFPEDGEFQVQFDTNGSEDENGVFYIGNGFFKHLFSPQLPELRRRVVFVLDISGSMAGLKIEQMRIAMSNILQNLDNRVYFNVVLFESVIRIWRRNAGLFPATSRNKVAAGRYINSLDPDGATNINDALLSGLRLLQRGAQNESPLRRLQVHHFLDYIVFLTDGRPTIGVRSSDVILRNVGRENTRGYGIISIGFGESVDGAFLENLAHRNFGTWRQIYEDADAAIQIQNFLADFLNAPLLLDFNLVYPPDTIERPTNLSGAVIRKGSQFLVSGRLQSGSTLKHGDVITVQVTGFSGNRVQTNRYIVPVRNVTTCMQADANDTDIPAIERLYALMKVSYLMRLVSETSVPQRREAIKKEAIDLSLQYSLVNNYTSLIVMESTPPTPHPTQDTISFSKRPIFEAKAPWVFQGDPHFVVKLNNNITVCFTMGGTPGKIYNLLYDPVHGISVMGEIVAAPPRPQDEKSKVNCRRKLPRTYFYKLALTLSKESVAFVVTPHDVTIYNRTDTKRTETSAFSASDEDLYIEYQNITLSVFGITKMHSFVKITLRRSISFVINLHRTRDRPFLNQTKPMGDHLDLDVDGVENLSAQSNGIFGDFSLKETQADKKNQILLRNRGNKWVLIYRRRHMEVQSTSIADPLLEHGTLQCWYTCEPEKLLGKPFTNYTSFYLLDSSFEIAY